MLSATMRYFNDQVGGTFKTVKGFPSPEQFGALVDLSKPQLFSLLAAFSEAEVKQMVASKDLDFIGGCVSVEVQHKRHRVRVFLTRMFLQNAVYSVLKDPYLCVYCCVRGKTGVKLSVTKAGATLLSGPTGQSALRTFVPSIDKQVLRKYMGGKSQKQSKSTSSVDTYFCPFPDSYLQDRYILRTSLVKLGNRFASDQIIYRDLSDLSGLQSFVLDEHAALRGHDYSIRGHAEASNDITQHLRLLELTKRTLDLLDEYEVLC